MEHLIHIGFFKRFIASFIDLILSLLFIIPLMYLVYEEKYWADNSMFFIGGYLGVMIQYIWPALINIQLNYEFQATPGKMLLKLKIVDASTGDNPSKIQFIKRYFAWWLSFFALGIGFFWMFFHPKKQTWHDIISNTIVVRGRVQKRSAEHVAIVLLFVPLVGLAIFKMNMQRFATEPVTASATSTTVRIDKPAKVSLYFDFGKADAPANANKELETLVAYANSNVHTKIVISGFRGSKGDVAKNAELPKNRARSVAETLVAAGLSEDRLMFEKSAQMGDGDDKEGRRVDVFVKQ